ncbi:hypothetical protein DIPPA_07743 [Diplonema papillatum]|nr:hypothetical protein DIPPA_07743 [Diplonema papillatum]
MRCRSQTAGGKPSLSAWWCRQHASTGGVREEGSTEADDTTAHEEDASSVPKGGQDGEKARSDRAGPSDTTKKGAEKSPTPDTTE